MPNKRRVFLHAITDRTAPSVRRRLGKLSTPAHVLDFYNRNGFKMHEKLEKLEAQFNLLDKKAKGLSGGRLERVLKEQIGIATEQIMLFGRTAILTGLSMQRIAELTNGDFASGNLWRRIQSILDNSLNIKKRYDSKRRDILRVTTNLAVVVRRN